MATELRIPPKSFKDYFLIMQVHPEADGAMIDAAYWHLARRYSEAAPIDASAKKKLDELNEAYQVLGSGPQRQEYEKLRAEVLGDKALPIAPQAPTPVQPLTVMQRQRPRAREDEGAEPEVKKHRRWIGGLPFRVPAWQNAISALIILMLAGAALASQVHPPLVIGLLIIGLSLTSIPLVRQLPKVASSAMAFQPAREPELAAAGSVNGDLDESASRAIAQLRETNAPRIESRSPPAGPEIEARAVTAADSLDEADELSESTSEAIARLREANAPQSAPKRAPAMKSKSGPLSDDDSDRLRKSTEAMVARLRENTAAAIQRNKEVDYAERAVDYETPPDSQEPTNAAAS